MVKSNKYRGQSINGWVVGDYIDSGKSASVFKCEKDGIVGAIKIMESDIASATPHEELKERIGRQQVASAAKFLEDKGQVHRDIKPANIVIAKDFTKATLLDLGVLRPMTNSGLTDSPGKKAFIGTLQYSSPEFLNRTEKKGYRRMEGAYLLSTWRGTSRFDNEKNHF